MMRPGLDGVSGVLNHPLIQRIRRNHSLEHATLHVLARRNPRTSMAGHSDPGGYWILGDVTLEEVKGAAQEALSRLKAGELSLALHPNCGTNIATAGMLAGVAGGLAMFGAGRRVRDKLERLPLAASLATLVMIFARPLGFFFQRRLTTSGEIHSLEIVDVRPGKRGWMRAHRVLTRG